MEDAQPDISRLNKFMATMFTPEITWDAAQRSIAEKMTDSERAAIAKRATQSLRVYLPEVLRCFKSFPSIREAMAEHQLLNFIDNQELLTPEQSNKHKRYHALSRQRMDDIDEIVQKYRTQAGYRSACLVLLIPDSSIRQNANDAQDILAALSEHQHIMFQGLMLQDLLRWIIKHRKKHRQFDFDPYVNKYATKLKARSSSLRTMIKSQNLTIEKLSSTDYLDSMNAMYTEVSDPIFQVITEFSAVVSCFKKMNEVVSMSIAGSTESLVSSNHFLSLSHLDVD